MKVICISGHAQNGKDTSALEFKNRFELKGYSVKIIHYADLLKYIARTYMDWDGEKDIKGRAILQELGTDIVRRKKPSFWVDFVVDILNFFEKKWDYVIIPDVRFPNEIEELKNNWFDVITVRVDRINFESPLTEEQQNHPSETALDNYSFDYYLINDTLKFLYYQIEFASELIVRDFPTDINIDTLNDAFEILKDMKYPKKDA